MDFLSINWLDALAAAGIVYGLLRGEQFYRVWKWKKSRKSPPLITADESTKGFVHGAAEAVACGRCGALTKDFFEYADLDKWCSRCDNEES